ncbi:UNVERIFIED_CONTAM: hypothetical protein PYX00_007671 [Menopon gallinae]|uniref:Uncharacterized protein n=1 Tax=Menopon gallinae TaxID=328185 RepID=A0AAW2HJP2_9NEOP
MMRAVTSLPKLTHSGQRLFSSSSRRFVKPDVLQKIQSQQAAFQADPNPVYLKGTAQTHFYITSALGVVTLALACKTMYEVVTKK